MAKKKIVETKKWTIQIDTYDDGTSSMTRTNDGFNPFELIGLAGLISHDVVEQIEGKIKPDRVKRKVLVD